MLRQMHLQRATAAIKDGQKDKARQLLAQLLDKDPRDIQAWLWMTEVVETDEERLQCLQKVLEIDPQHQQALVGAQRLQAKLAGSQVQAAEQAEPQEVDLVQTAEPEPQEAEQEEGEGAEQADQPAPADPLLAALRAASAETRLMAVEALIARDDPRAAGLLMGALRDQSRSVRQASAKALGKLGDPRAVKPLVAALRDEDDDVRHAVSAALAEIGRPATKALLATLKGRSRLARQAAAEALVRMEPSVQELFIPLLQHPDRPVRKVAAWALGELGWQPPSSETEAIYWVAQAEWDKCLQVGEAALEPLTAVLQDVDSGVRLGAVGVLAKIAHPRSAHSLVEALRDRNSRVQEAASNALVKIAQPALDPLLDALKNWNTHRLRRRVAEALDKFGWQPESDEFGALYWIAKSEWDKCAELGQTSVRPLIATLQDRDSGVRWAAAGLLDQLGWAPTQDEIGATYWIAKADWSRCIHIGEPAVAPLIAVLWDEDKWVRQGAAGALERIGTREAAAALDEWRRTHTKR